VYARKRAGEIEVLDRLYGYANHRARLRLVERSAAVDDEPTVEQLFESLAAEWRKDTKYMSSLSKMSMHHAYQRIIGLGMAAVPLILQDLEETGDHWLWALHAITGKDPAAADDNMDAAISAWLEWGRHEGHIL
jgi:hypothetical protein